MSSKHRLQVLYMPLILLILISGLSSASAQVSMAKPHCTEKCGDIIIPYPFGIGDSRCFRNRWFEITCNKSISRPFLHIFNLEVLEISLGVRPETILVYNPIYSTCRDGGLWNSTDLNGTPFTFSTDNKLYNVGCENILMGCENKVLPGCTPKCKHSNSSFTSDCDGIGCCQMSVDLPFNFYWLMSTTVNTSACTYAFLASEYDLAWNFSWNPSSIKRVNATPVSIIWKTQMSDLPQVMDSSKAAYLCDYSIIADSYICRCDSYVGNPYILNGCGGCAECEGQCQKDSRYFYCNPSVVNRGKMVFVVKAMGGGALLVMLFIFCIVLYKFIKKRRKLRLKQKFYKRNGGLLLQQKLSTNEGSLDTTRIFSVKELEKATDNFNVSRVLGQGGQGTVYKGMLMDGMLVAVKKSKLVDEGHQVEQFINEVVILSQINHRNIVKLLGCCLETEVPLLVYEFISNGTLSQLIHNQDEFPLSWEMRLRIATEVSGALAYLHSATSLPIYHRDVKSSNILLDDKYRVKVADFGTSRSVAIDQTHFTTMVQGTFGYLDPEFFQSSQFTDKSDVYSFGVVLAELLTGERAIMMRGESEEKSLVGLFISSMEKDSLFNIIDERVAREGNNDGIIELAILTRSCLNLNGKQRPAMKQVMLEIERIRTRHMPPSISKIIRHDQSSSKKMEEKVSSLSFSNHIESFEHNACPLLFDEESESYKLNSLSV